MENRRYETAPAWLVALAAAALGLSWAVTRQWSATETRAQIDQPARTTGPLRWSLVELEPLPLAELPAQADAPTLAELMPSRVALLVPRPRLTPPPARDLAGLRGAVPQVTEPLTFEVTPASSRQAGRRAAATAPSGGFAGRIVILVPAEPRWRSGRSLPRVVTARMRSDWSVGPVDTLALAWTVGRQIAAGDVVSSAEAAASRLRVAGGWVDGRLASAPSTNKLRRPRLVAPTRRSPVIRQVSLPVAARPLPSITDYLARSSDAGAFPAAVALGPQLDRVAESRDLAPWAWAVAYRLRTLAATSVENLSAHRELAALADASQEAFAEADRLADPAKATELRRAGYALSRRLTTWQAEQTQTLAARCRPSTRDTLAGARWAMSPQGLGIAPGLALSDSDDFALASPTLRVAQRLEAYERAPTSRLARALAADAADLREEADAESQRLAQAIDGSYRNANLRVAIAAGLIERMLPKPEPITSMVRDRVAGTPVTGRSTTRTELAIRLVEDRAAWRFGLEARGLVTASTQSRGGPAVLSSRGTTSFVAKKLVVLTAEGLQAAPAVADAQAESQRLVGLSTSYDRVPLLGNYVRSTARSEYGRLRGRAVAETQLKVERQVCKTLDARVTPQLAEAERRFATDVASRLEGLGLDLEPIEMRTTAERLISRVRIANELQLGAHTPRMRAPSDSLLSLQMHESVLNNALEGLDLAGATLTTAELRERLVERLRLPERESEPQDEAVLRFADADPIRFEFAEGRAQLTLSLAEISVRGRRHRDFKVHAFYRPEANGLTAELVQDGAPHIEGRMRSSSRLHLHAVMGKVLGENQRVAIVRLNEQTPERVAVALTGLATNQLVIEDGWLGLAIGPQRPVGRVAVQVGGYVR